MYAINRSVAVIKPRQPFLDWANNLTDPEENFTLDEFRTDCTAILIPEFDTQENSMAYLRTIYTDIFEIELDSWIRNRRYWPRERNFQTFKKWFDVEIHSIVLDTSNERIVKEPFWPLQTGS